MKWGRCGGSSGNQTMVILKETPDVERVAPWEKVAHTTNTGFLEKGLSNLSSSGCACLTMLLPASSPQTLAFF